MNTANVRVARRSERFLSDDSRVIARYLNFGDSRRIKTIVQRAQELTEDQVTELLAEVLGDFSGRHRDLKGMFREHFQVVSRFVKTKDALSDARKLLIGSFFTLEYSFESAALFNPSMVLDPDQGGLGDGSARFLMSMRATGEGHISSIVFRRGVIDGSGRIEFDPPPRYAYSARPVGDKQFAKRLFFRKLTEMGTYPALARTVLDDLPDPFTVSQLRQAIDQARERAHRARAFRSVAADMLWLAGANYELRFPSDCRPAEIVIFPATENESRGMEDLRLVRFVQDDGEARYYGTYTAYDGKQTLPMLLETTDFCSFHVSTLCGTVVHGKGMALFPRRINGAYVLISRHDGENLYLCRSDDLYVWNDSALLQGPAEPWELVQIGNCGSPVETEAGWILLTHGVGPVRRYCIGAMLLDREDPSKVIGRLRDPLIIPNQEEREGYVPNVVYSCGPMIHGDQLVIPYAMADLATAFATVSVKELLGALGAG